MKQPTKHVRQWAELVRTACAIIAAVASVVTVIVVLSR